MSPPRRRIPRIWQRLLFRPRPLDAAAVEARVAVHPLPLAHPQARPRSVVPLVPQVVEVPVAHLQVRLLPALQPVAPVVEVRVVAQFRQFLAAALRLLPADAVALQLR